MLHKVSRQGAVIMVSRGAAVLLGIGATIFLSRLLGPSGFGKFRLGSVAVQLMTGFCILGLDRALMRYLPMLEARGEGGSRALLLRSSAVVLGIAIACSIALLLAAPVLAMS